SNTIQCEFTHFFMGRYTRHYHQTLFENFTNWLYEVTHTPEDNEKYFNKESEERFLTALFSKCPSTGNCKFEFQDLNTKGPKLHGNFGDENYVVLNRAEDEITLLNAAAARGVSYPITVYRISFIDGTVIQTTIAGDAIRYSATNFGRCF
ncbi:MAG: hypothetical protein Q7T11_08505, partial [Deltaproteobacteria bacterium]|nr:hypothetical protein [Deltaproteobacteria bacterium]